MQTRGISFWKRLQESALFFQGHDEVCKSLRRLIKNLAHADIPYAVMGGMAMHAHGHRLPPEGLDILLTPPEFTQFREQFVPKKYGVVPKRSRRFTDTANEITVDILVTGLFPGSGKSGPIAFPYPQMVAQTLDKIQVVDLVTLIQLKLAARRYQDFADVVNLIRAHELDESFASRLHESLRRDFIECLEEKRREDEYEALNG
jgi:hypothetical protein